MERNAVAIDRLTIADGAAAWEALGFAVEGDLCTVGAIGLRLVGEGAGRGICGWSLRGIAADADLDGLPTARSDGEPAEPSPPHPNGIVAVDHIVAITPNLDRTVAALSAAGLDLRRIREEPTPAGAPRQAFFRLGETILEVVQEPPEAIEKGGGPDRPAFFWGLAFSAPELERTVAALGEAVSEVRPAVQPGRRIATLRRAAGLGLPVALITPRPAASA